MHTNKAEPDQTAPKGQSDLGLSCLLRQDLQKFRQSRSVF